MRAKKVDNVYYYIITCTAKYKNKRKGKMYFENIMTRADDVNQVTVTIIDIFYDLLEL